MSIKAVIFDLDGTITEPYFDFDAIREEIGVGRDSGPLLETVRNMTAEERQNAERILHEHERRAVEVSRLNPGAGETIKSLRASGILVGILTRNQRENAIAVARKHNLEFDGIVGREDGPAKPDSFGVVHLCEQFAVDPSQTMVVGDYLFDLQCAKTAGAIAVWLKNNHHSQDFSREADFCVDNVGQILEIVKLRNR
jgi:HAD superfamily hydrolase (TIGR01509 family)